MASPLTSYFKSDGVDEQLATAFQPRDRARAEDHEATDYLCYLHIYMYSRAAQ